MERRSECRVFSGESATVVFTTGNRSGVLLRQRQCGNAAEQSPGALVVDEAADRPAAAAPGIRSRHTRAPVARQYEGSRAAPTLSGRNDFGCRESLPVYAIRG